VINCFCSGKDLASTFAHRPYPLSFSNRVR